MHQTGMNQTNMDQTHLIRAGVGAVVFRDDKVLLIQRGKEPFKGHWSIPGGGIHYGEPLEEAVRREVREETAIEINVLGLLNVYEFLPKAYPGTGKTFIDTPPARSEQTPPQDPHFLMIDYVASWVSGEPSAGDDAADALFLPLEQAIEKIGWDTTRTAVQTGAQMMAKGSFVR